MAAAESLRPVACPEGLYSVGDLLRQVALIHEELRGGLLRVDSEQANIRWRAQALEDEAKRASDRYSSLEARASRLEREQQSTSVYATSSFEALSSRLVAQSELMASWPAPAEVRSKLDSLTEASKRADTRISVLEFDREAVYKQSHKLSEQAQGLEDAVKRCQADIEGTSAAYEASRKLAEQTQALQDAVRRWRADAEGASAELRQAVQRQGQEHRELVEGLRAALAETASRGLACEGRLEELGAAASEAALASQSAERRLTELGRRAAEAEGSLQQLAARAGKHEGALEGCRADLKSTLSLSCRHGRDTVQDLGSLKLQSQICQHHIGELRRALDKVCQQGIQCQRDVKDLHNVFRLRGQRGGPPCSDPRHWSEGQLRLWLEDQGLPAEIARAFEAHLVNGLVGKDLVEEDLTAMGVADPMLRRRVLRELHGLFCPPAPGETAGKAVAGAPAALEWRAPRPQSARAAPGPRSPPRPSPPAACRRGARPASASLAPVRQRRAEEADAAAALAWGVPPSPPRPARESWGSQAPGRRAEPAAPSGRPPGEAEDVPDAGPPGAALEELERLALRYEGPCGAGHSPGMAGGDEER